jgi:hypothetical protein
MKMLNSFIFLILITFIFSFDPKSCTATSYSYNLIDYENTERVIEFDWTDDDVFDLKINFINDVSGTIEPYFVNATAENSEEDDYAYDPAMINETDTEGHFVYNLITNPSVSGKSLSAQITPAIVSANADVITQKFYKYFGWVECANYQSARFRKSQILVVVNNGKLYEMSKYLLFVAAALLL